MATWDRRRQNTGELPVREPEPVPARRTVPVPVEKLKRVLDRLRRL
jgi:hypothetical protein